MLAMRIVMLAAVACICGAAGDAGDRLRPVTRVGADSFTIQYFTATPCETRVQLREAGLPAIAWRADGKWVDPWVGATRIVEGEDSTPTNYHRLTLDHLKSGTRYFYRVFDPGASPSDDEKHWGAAHPWRREYAVSTRAGNGKRTIIHLPVKVLLMPNVVSIASARSDNGEYAPAPAKMSEQDIERIKHEYAIASRYFFVNSGLHLWVDFQVVVDDRFQRWSEEPTDAPDAYKNWPACRSYPGKDFDPPGGGTFTIVDVRDPKHATTEPIDEDVPFTGQVEQAIPRRWNAKEKRWVFYNSGGGTFGVDELWHGIPARSQFLGGGDTAWLATHELHHQLESMGAFSLADREDDRIIFNHPSPRFLRKTKDGKIDSNPWSTTGPRQGEQWDVMAWSDRLLSEAQWLRFYFGETIVVTDSDNDGVPDDDERLPMDEKRFGSDRTKPKTDGAMNDRDKLMLSIWAPAPLQPTWNKPPWQGVKIDPRNPDTDLDGIADVDDPYPLYPWPPFVWPISATIDGDAKEWKNVPLAGELRQAGIHVTFKQAHDEKGYFGAVTGSGEWKKIELILDGEGDGAFSHVGVYHLEIKPGDDGKVEMKAPREEEGAKLTWKASRNEAAREDVIEFSLPNAADEKSWHWHRGGRDIGACIFVTARDGKIYSIYEPYMLFYARMLENQ
jgi:hypothetical protein